MLNKLVMLQFGSLSSVMDAGDHFKNGARPKILIGRSYFSFFCLLITVMMMFFTACDSNDFDSTNDGNLVIIEDPTSDNPFVIKANDVENGISGIASIKSVGITYCPPENECQYLDFSTEYKNGGFELNLPATIPDEFLQSFSEKILMENNIHVSDTQAKITSFSLLAHNSAEAWIGSIDFRSDNWHMQFIYADRSFTEKGVTLYGVEIDCSYKKGWNIVYVSRNFEIADAGSKQTTQKPLSENFKCYFSHGFGY
jgi:hypothetical protein